MVELTDIPVIWIKKQIKENPGYLASAWSRLLGKWEHYILYGDTNGQKTEEDQYIKMHESVRESERFWKNA